MRPPIRERIVVFRYKPLDDAVYSGVLDSLSRFLKDHCSADGFKEETMNRPVVTLPLATIGDKEPDWSSLKVSVDRPSRFWSEDRAKCVQFFNDYLTFNLITQQARPVRSHEDLFDFFMKFLPFLEKHRKDLSITKAGIDYLNELDPDQLSPFTVNAGRTLEIARILRGPMLGQKIDGAMFTPPVIHKFSYAPNETSSGSFPAVLSVEIVLPENKGNGWNMRVLFSASGEFPGFAQPGISRFLEQMHDAVRKGFLSTFTEEFTKPTGDEA